VSIEENKALLHRLYDLWNRRQLAAYYELYEPEFLLHGGGHDLSLEWMKQFDAQVDAGFSSAGTTIDNMVAEADRVAFQAHISITHTGQFMGIDPTGKKFEMTPTHIVRIAAGRVAEWWGTSEWPRVMQELGVVRPTGQ
jgi:ketosteroid isomerase-like protein